MQTPRFVVVLACIAGLFLALPSSAPAAGKFKIKPMVTVSARMETNFFNTEENERDVYTFLAQPGIQLGYETEKTKALFNYTAEGYMYEDVGDAPEGAPDVSDLNYIGHLAALDLSYRPVRRITLSLKDSFYRTRYPTAYDRLSDSIERARYDINRLTPGVFYDFENRFSAGLRYQRTDIWFEEADPLDSTEHRFIGNLLYNPTRTSTFDLELQYWWTDFDISERDYDAYQAELIFQKRYKHFAFDAGLGYQTRDYDNPALDDGDGVIAKLSVLYQNPPPPEGRRYLGSEFVRAKTHAFLGIERALSNYSNLTADRLTWDFGHVFWGKIQARIKGYYQLSDYDDLRGLTRDGRWEVRDDDTFRAVGSLGYLISDRMDVTFSAGLEERDSNIAGGDYENEFMMLMFNFNFDFKSRGGFTEESLYYL